VVGHRSEPFAHSSSLSAGQDGTDSGADTSNSFATVEGEKAKGLRLPSTDLYRTSINCKKGAQDRGTNALRMVIRSADHPERPVGRTEVSTSHLPQGNTDMAVAIWFREQVSSCQRETVIGQRRMLARFEGEGTTC
jgi:hypothetical protein